ncbi:MAG: PrsW family intramembrane metalloprotease [Ardenticatenaceae bacterium]|nr:PrsW family intramembrane metalloprotease [Ardenticatenaceae bacterium]
MILGTLVAVAVPLAFLALVRWLDLYASGSFEGVLVCLGWGLAAFWLAFLANTLALGRVGFALLVLLVAPVIEEALKSLILVYYVRRADFTYFVDGAIYGFAAGTGFAVLENLLSLSRTGNEVGLAVASSRAFSTALMHGSASALVGVSLGRLRFGCGASRFGALLVGWAAAMSLHITFNNVVNRNAGVLTPVLAVAIGLGGVVLIAAFIFWGLRQERRWLRETLGLKVGVSAGESAVVLKLDDLDRLLAPVGEYFGEDRRVQVKVFLRLQAQLGLKRKVQELTPDPKLRTEMEAQVSVLRREIDTVRRGLGVYCMACVRSILPPETEPLWVRLGQTLETRPRSSGSNLWGALGERMNSEQ